ncbi:MAG: bifunctional hydroxymethylpyrimidine kinase/phosphomethylpyrimidine kinase [Kiritimatiellae bacterium]|nr:bifunctional hydroxymethylpyrimidine kinase/phosphomethylpyrimidine kinase [Kiritimatiellia bacterium]
MNDESQDPDVPVALTIAGSDSGGGAGIQADLLTFAAFDVFGTSALTCVTAQNPREVTGIQALPPEFVAQQIKTVCDAFPVAAAKTGMLFSSPIIRAVAAADVQQGIPILVVDPVMVAASGARLLEPEAIEALCGELLSQARVITPNLDEAAILCGHPIESVEQMREAAREIGDRYDVACAIKGGHLAGPDITDVLYDEGQELILTGPRLAEAETHGAGCAFSAAVTAGLAKGWLLEDAVTQAREFVRRAMESARSAGTHRPLYFLANIEPEASD